MHVLKTLSWLTFLGAALWFYASPDFEPALALLTGLAGVLTARQASSKATAKEAVSQPVESEWLPHQPLPRYAQTVGARLRWLREEVLELSLREMAEFLSLDAIGSLERFESGEIEYPLPLVKRIEAFFRFNPRFVETGAGTIFQHFHLGQQQVNEFVSLGYRPLLACSPNDRSDLLCNLVFERETEGHVQLALADRYGSFASSGGGRINIEYLINALLDAGKSSSFVRIVKATEEEWNAILRGTYYSKHPFHRFGCADWDCMGVFDAWYEENKKGRARWASRTPTDSP